MYGNLSSCSATEWPPLVNDEELEEICQKFQSVLPPDATYDTIDEDRFLRIFSHFAPWWDHDSSIGKFAFRVCSPSPAPAPNLAPIANRNSTATTTTRWTS